jgi:hypothetical protein
MCQLEMCFPTSFFDTMEHNTIHLADQIFILGPTYMHHMYLWEHHMVVMKGYVCNHSHSKVSMIEGYTTEEVIEYCVDYIKDRKPIGVPVSRRHCRLSQKEPNDINHSLMLLTKGSVRHILASLTS